MSYQSFIRLLQEIVTMVDPENRASTNLANVVLESVIALASSSDKLDSTTWRAMLGARAYLPYLITHRDEFAGVPGDFAGNQAKRNRLSCVIAPSC